MSNLLEEVRNIEEGFASDAQRRAAFASGYKEKGKKKKEDIDEAGFVGRKDPMPAGKELAKLMKKKSYAFPRPRPGLKDFKKGTTKTKKEEVVKGNNQKNTKKR